LAGADAPSLIAGDEDDALLAVDTEELSLSSDVFSGTSRAIPTLADPFEAFKGLSSDDSAAAVG
jgi:hypothetical protein